MKIPSKRILHDDSGQPVETRMDYEEFRRVEQAVETKTPYELMLSFAGTVDFGGEDGMEYQRRLRAEWD